MILISAALPVYASAAESACAGQNSWLGSWLGQDTATGNWGGLRGRLVEKGITLSSSFTMDIAWNPAGGRRQGSTYAGFLELAAALDFEKLDSLKGWALTVSNYLASGNNLSNKIGNFFGVQEIYSPGDYYFGELDLSYTLPGDKLTLEAGRLFAGDVFATSPLWQYYVSAINGNLVSMSGNVFFPHFQVAAWGARATCEPNKQWQLAGGIYDANPAVRDPERHGVNFNLHFDKGYLAVGQATFKHHQGREEGLGGSATVGGYYESSKFSYLSDPARSRRGNYGFYFIMDQMLYRGDWPEFTGPAHLRSQAPYSESVKFPYHQQNTVAADRPKGLTAWWAGYLAPQETINAQTYQLAGGLVYQGLPPNRDRDVTAFCVIYGNFSDDLPGQDAETVLELNHRFQLGPWCYISPDIQYIFNPNGRHDIKNALVLGVETSFNF
ncbi:MAG: carbohydrate porin [Candidatus Omnitrophica bacterium]|nr:carbohydrate porin [Candidatus Omnitrophota bacterium]